MPHLSDPARPPHGASSIGERIKHLRGHMTQAALAAASGVSLDSIRKLEQGQRYTCNVATLHKLARALDVPAGILLDRPRPLERGGEDHGAVAIRRAIASYDDLIGDNDLEVEPLTVADGKRALTLGWHAYWAGEYGRLGQILPTAILRARAAVLAVPTAEHAQAADVAAEVLHLAASTLVHLGYTDISHLALREARAHALHSDDPHRIDAVTCGMAWTLLVEGRFREGARLATTTAQAMGIGGKSPEQAWAVYGSLLVTAATSTGRVGDRTGALSLMDEASTAADVTGNTGWYQMNFGAGQIGMQRVDIETVSEHYAGAIAAARKLPADLGLPDAAAARHLSDVALAHTRLGHDGAALDVLEQMVRLAPAWASWQEQPKLIVRELRQQHLVSSGRRLTELARKIGVDEG